MENPVTLLLVAAVDDGVKAAGGRKTQFGFRADAPWARIVSPAGQPAGRSRQLGCREGKQPGAEDEETRVAQPHSGRL